METIDLRKQMKDLWGPPAGTVVLVTVPALKYLTVDGEGNPNTSTAFKEAIQALYSMAFTLKFGARQAGVADWKVTPLEGLWWSPTGKNLMDEPQEAAAMEMAWKALLMQPDVVTEDMVQQAKATIVQKKKNGPALDKVRLETWEEGLCVQTMHIGPYAGERSTAAMMFDWMRTHGFTPRGRHHELYLSDPNRTAPERMKTILRMPVEKVTA